MAKNAMECKKMMVQEISDRISDKPSAIVTNFKGLTAKDLNELRRELREVSCEYVVVKDSIAKHALAKNPILELIEGEVGIALDTKEDATYISKILVKFLKSHEALNICGGVVSGEVITKEDIKVLAALPSREVLLGKLANVLNAPIQGLASSLSQIITKLAYVLNALKDKKPAKVEPKPEIKEEPKAEAKPEANATPKAETPKEESKPEVKPEPKPEANEVKEEPKPEVTPEAKAEDKPKEEQKPDTQNKEE